MKKNKPDALLILAVIFGLGILASAISHGGGEDQPPAPAALVSSINR